VQLGKQLQTLVHALVASWPSLAEACWQSGFPQSETNAFTLKLSRSPACSRDPAAHLALVLGQLRVQIPEPHCSIPAATSEVLAIRAESHLHHQSNTNTSLSNSLRVHAVVMVDCTAKSCWHSNPSPFPVNNSVNWGIPPDQHAHRQN
jgi:hypothetical protein